MAHFVGRATPVGGKRSFLRPTFTGAKMNYSTGAGASVSPKMTLAGAPGQGRTIYKTGSQQQYGPDAGKPLPQGRDLFND